MTSVYKICIAGGRDFNNYSVLRKIMDLVLKDYDQNIVIISGGAHGADSLGELYAREHDIPLETYPADWKNDWKGAGFTRNKQMAIVADELIAFWDGESHGTKHMINEMISQNKPVKIFDYLGNSIKDMLQI